MQECCTVLYTLCQIQMFARGYVQWKNEYRFFLSFPTPFFLKPKDCVKNILPKEKTTINFFLEHGPFQEMNL